MKLITAILLFFNGALCMAQSPAYCVYLLTGKATVRSGNNKPVALTRSQVLYADQLISLSKNAKLTLVNKEADYLVLNSAGEYKVSDLHKQVSKQAPGVTKKYFALLWNEMVKPASSYQELVKTSKSGIMGGVTRGTDNCTALLFPADGLKTAAGSITITWHRPDEDEEFLFSLYNSSGTELIKQTVKDTQYVIDVANQLGGKEGRYFFKVSGKRYKACKSDATVLDVINKSEEINLVESYRILQAKAKDKDITLQLDFIDKIVGEKRILFAEKIYRELVKQYPENSFLSKSYLLFLTGYGFDEKAKAFAPTINFK